MEHSALPDELWRLILEIGIQTPCNDSPNNKNSSPAISYKDLCCLSITCRRLNRLSNDDSLWSSLLSSDFPQSHDNPRTPPQPFSFSSSSSSSNNGPSFNSSSKSLYKIRIEKDRARKLAAHRRAVLRIESQIAEHSRKLQEIQFRAAEETQKMKTAVAELSNLRKARQASVALNVWQPEVIRGRHKQIVEQCAVPADSRIHALEMEVRLCKQQITGLDKAYRDERKRLDAAKEQLGSMKYHPLRDYTSTSSRVDECGIKRKKLRKDNIIWAAAQVQEERKQ